MRLAHVHGHELDLVLVAQQVLGKPAADIGIEADVASDFIDKAKQRLVGKHADNQLVASLDLVDITHRRRRGSGGFGRFFSFVAAGPVRPGRAAAVTTWQFS